MIVNYIVALYHTDENYDCVRIVQHLLFDEID